MEKLYVEQRDQGYWISGSRVSLESIIFSFLDGLSPETMPGHFGRFIMSEKSPGLLIVSQKWPISRVAEDLFLIWSASESEEWVNRIRSLPI